MLYFRKLTHKCFSKRTKKKSNYNSSAIRDRVFYIIRQSSPRVLMMQKAIGFNS